MPPTTPTAVRVHPADGNRVEVAWDAAPDTVAVAAYELLRDGQPRARVAVTHAADGPVRPLVRLCYAVRALDAAGNRSAPSAPACVTVPDTTSPAPPAKFAAVPTGENSVSLRWGAARDDVGVVSYEVRRADRVVATTTALEAVDRGLRAWTEYCYTVRAIDGARNRSAPAGPACARTRDTTPPRAPSAVRAVARPPDAIDLRWNAASDDGEVSAYVVAREGKPVARVSEPAASDAGLRHAVPYCYTVTAIDRAGNVSKAGAPACATLPDTTPPSTPASVSAVPHSEREIDVHWVAATDNHRVAAYEVLQGGRAIATVDVTSYVAGGLKAGASACFTVRARDVTGNVSPETAPACGTTPDETPPTVPGELARVAATDTTVRLAWRPSQDNVGVMAYEVSRDGAPMRQVLGPELLDTGRRVAHRYCYEVRARDLAGNRSAWAGPLCVTTPDLAPPTTPARLEAVSGDGRIRLGWSAATDDVGVAAYEVSREGAVVGATTDTTYANQGVPGARSCFTVRAVDAAGNRSPPTNAACAIAPDPLPPSAPQRLRAASATEHRIELRWAASTDNIGVAGYELLRGDRVVETVSNTSGAEPGLLPAREYCFKVRAFDAAGNRSVASEPVCATTPDLTAPELAGPLTATATGERAVSVAWPAANDNVAVTGYEVEREGAAGRTVEATVLADEGLSPAHRYCYRVKALDAAGHRSRAARACVTTPDLTPPEPPRDLEAAPTATQIALRWAPSTDNVGVRGYEVLRGDAVLAQVEGPAAVDVKLELRNEYCYRVRALDAARNRSAAVGPLCATTIDPSLPLAPRGLAAAPGAAPADVKLTWEASPIQGVVYRVYADRRSIGATRYLNFTVKEPAPKERCFRITAVDERGRESLESNEACGREPAPASP